MTIASQHQNFLQYVIHQNSTYASGPWVSWSSMKILILHLIKLQ